MRGRVSTSDCLLTSFECSERLLVPFEVLNGPLMFLGGGATCERSQVAPLAGFGVLLARVQTVLAGLQVTNHRGSSCPESCT